MRTQADDDAYKVRMEDALASCSAKKDAISELVDAFNKLMKPKKLFGVF
jgi:hypothetical protein